MRLGIYGGSFDPVHRAHIGFAQSARQQLKLDEVRLLPCGIPSHRAQYHAPADDRLAMLGLASIGISGLVVDDWEINQPSTSYTYKTLEYFSSASRQLFFLLGQDSLESFHTWENWQRILELAALVVFKRPGDRGGEFADIPNAVRESAVNICEHTPELNSGGPEAGNIYFIKLDEMNCSSSGIRTQIQKGDKPSDWLDPAVMNYIAEKKLYHYDERKFK